MQIKMINLQRAEFKDTPKIKVKENDAAGYSGLLKFNCSVGLLEYDKNHNHGYFGQYCNHDYLKWLLVGHINKILYESEMSWFSIPQHSTRVTNISVKKQQHVL